MSIYFSNFKNIPYKNKLIKDISRRAIFPSKYTENPHMFLTYAVEGDDKPEDIAYHYYGSSDYTWLVCIANNIFDQYSDWVLSSDNFDAMMTKKYAKISGKKSRAVIDWTMNETITKNILYFEKDGVDYSVDTVLIDNVAPSILQNRSSPTYDSQVIAAFSAASFRPVRIYEKEYLDNEDKRNIILLDSRYLSQARDDFAEAMKR